MNSQRIAFVFFLLALPAGLWAQTAPAPVTCTAASVKGTHAFVITGRNLNSALAISNVLQGDGTATFDGVGAVSFVMVTSTNVAQAQAQTWSGTYTLASNCTGTLTVSSGENATFTMIAYSNGLGFSLIGQDGTYALTGTGTTQPAACITSSVSGAYTFSGQGYALAGGKVSGVNTLSGLLQFDGRGGITGNWSLATNTTATPDAVTGTYSVSAQCVGTGTLADKAGATWTLNFVVTTATSADFTMDMASPVGIEAVTGHETFTNPGLSVTDAADGTSSTTPPGSVFALYGSGMATGSASATAVPLPTALLGTSVTVNGVAAPLFYMSSGQINAQMPWKTTPGLATVVVSNGGTLSNAVAVEVPAAATPEILTYNTNRAVVQNADHSVNTATNPAKVGETLVAYFEGGGPVKTNVPLVSGAAAPGALSPVTGTPVKVTVAGNTANVTYIGLTPTAVGLYQVNFVVPKVAAGDRALVISIGGVASPNALISVSD